MTFRVIVLPRAMRQLVASAKWWSENRSTDQAVQWLDGFEAALTTLETDPDRLPVAPENDRFSFTVRQLLYRLGSKKTHRAVFTVRGHEVLVFAVRHLHQHEISPESI